MGRPPNPLPQVPDFSCVAGVKLSAFDAQGQTCLDMASVGQSAERGRRHSVHSCAGLRDDAQLAHAQGEHDLPEHIAHLVRARVIEVLTLEVDLRTADPLGQTLRVVERRRSSVKCLEVGTHLSEKARVGLRVLIGALQIVDDAASRSRRQTARHTGRTAHDRRGQSAASSSPSRS